MSEITGVNSSFTWNIPSLSPRQQSLLVTGYIRGLVVFTLMNQKMVTVLLDLCHKYFSLNDAISIDDILTCQSNGVLKSDIFEMFHCKWQLCLYFGSATIWRCHRCSNSNCDTTWYCRACKDEYHFSGASLEPSCVMSVGLEIVSLPNTISGVSVRTAARYLHAEPHLQQKKSGKWLFTMSNPVQRFFDLLIHADDIKATKALKLKVDVSLLLTRSDMDINHYLMQYNLVKDVSNFALQQMTQRFEAVQQQLNDIQRQLQHQQSNDLNRCGTSQAAMQTDKDRMRVHAWLSLYNCAHYYELFVMHGIDDLRTVKLLSMEHLQSIGVSLGHCLRLMQGIQKMNEPTIISLAKSKCV